MEGLGSCRTRRVFCKHLLQLSSAGFGSAILPQFCERELIIYYVELVVDVIAHVGHACHLHSTSSNRPRIWRSSESSSQQTKQPAAGKIAISFPRDGAKALQQFCRAFAPGDFDDFS